jgi:hypothetical protein
MTQEQEQEQEQEQQQEVQECSICMEQDPNISSTDRINISIGGINLNINVSGRFERINWDLLTPNPLPNPTPNQ